MLDDIIKERKKKLDAIIARGLNPYPARVKRTHTLREARENFEAFSSARTSVSLVGRVVAFRDQGGVVFCDLNDSTDKLQVVLKKEDLKDFDFIVSVLDIGDFLEVTGMLFATQRGEQSIAATNARVIVKSLRPFPTSWSGLKDIEERYRRRYIDMVLNPEVKEVFLTRSRVVQEIRTLLLNEGFIEVETPVLQPIPGGALAKPFTTHHNALDIDLYLRVSPELYLKRCLVGGMNKVFEFARDFRNEGVDRDHYPEFTMLEFYSAYQDYEGLMDFTEKMLKPYLPGSWERIRYADTFKKYAGRDLKDIPNEQIDEVFKKEVRPKIQEPTFVTHYPKAISPLSKSVEGDPELTERFQVVVEGTEIVNAFSELNDPVDQRERMEEQERQHRAGNEEASRFDGDFVEALEYGMPPAAGLGLGIDRLVQLMTKSKAIKDTIIFPTMRSRDEGDIE